MFDFTKSVYHKTLYGPSGAELLEPIVSLRARECIVTHFVPR